MNAPAKPRSHEDGDDLEIKWGAAQMAQHACQTVHGDDDERGADGLADGQSHQHHKRRHDQEAAAHAQKAREYADARPTGRVTAQPRELPSWQPLPLREPFWNSLAGRSVKARSSGV